jgi:hypothetical protein
VTGNDARDHPDDALPIEVLADLHAEVLDDQQAAALRRRAAADPRAGTVLAALDATVGDLAALRAQPVPMPRSVSDRIDSALAAETLAAETLGAAAGVQPPVPLRTGSARRRRTAAWAGAAVLAAAAALVGVVALVGVHRYTAGVPRAGDSMGAATGVSPSAPLALTDNDLGSAVSRAMAQRDLGPLAEPGRLPGCLAANGVPSGTDPLGAMEITVDGSRGVLLVLPTGQIGRFRLLVVGDDCAPGTPSLLADHLIGHR